MGLLLESVDSALRQRLYLAMASSPSVVAQLHANGDVNHQVAPRRQPVRRGWLSSLWAWIDRKIFLYNVTTGLYMLDWWERYLVNAIVLLLLWLIGYNGVHAIARLVVGTVAWHNRNQRGFLQDLAEAT